MPPRSTELGSQSPSNQAYPVAHAIASTGMEGEIKPVQQQALYPQIERACAIISSRNGMGMAPVQRQAVQPQIESAIIGSRNGMGMAPVQQQAVQPQIESAIPSRMELVQWQAVSPQIEREAPPHEAWLGSRSPTTGAYPVAHAIRQRQAIYPHIEKDCGALFGQVQRQAVRPQMEEEAPPHAAWLGSRSPTSCAYSVAAIGNSGNAGEVGPVRRQAVYPQIEGAAAAAGSEGEATPAKRKEALRLWRERACAAIFFGPVQREPVRPQTQEEAGPVAAGGLTTGQQRGAGGGEAPQRAARLGPHSSPSQAHPAARAAASTGSEGEARPVQRQAISRKIETAITDGDTCCIRLEMERVRAQHELHAKLAGAQAVVKFLQREYEKVLNDVPSEEEEEGTTEGDLCVSTEMSGSSGVPESDQSVPELEQAPEPPGLWTSENEQASEPPAAVRSPGAPKSTKDAKTPGAVLALPQAPAETNCVGWKQGVARPLRPLGPRETTLAVRNVPARYMVEELVAEWLPDGPINFLYRPYGFEEQRPLGHAFVNFTTNAAATAFQERWHAKFLRFHGKGRALDIVGATTQGYKANLLLALRQLQGHDEGHLFVPALFKRGERLDVRKEAEKLGLQAPKEPEPHSSPEASTKQEPHSSSDSSGARRWQ